jgi:hypothetical protein
MAASKKKRTKSTRSTTWDRITHNWSWLDSAFSGGLMLAVGYLIGQGNYFDLTMAEQLKFNHTWFMFLAKLFGAGFFYGRMWNIARHPRPVSSKVDWGKLTASQMIVTLFRDHYVSIIAGVMALAFTFSAAPEGLSLFEAVNLK